MYAATVYLKFLRNPHFFHAQIQRLPPSAQRQKDGAADSEAGLGFLLTFFMHIPAKSQYRI